jgi:hypothetical protein
MAGRLSSSSGGRLGGGSTGRLPSAGLSDTQDLINLAKQKGVYDQVKNIVEDKPKLSVLQRLGAGLGAFNPAEAVLKAREDNNSVGTFATTYVKNVAQGLGSALTGNDYQPGRRSFKDVAESLGVENGIAKIGLGFAGDVLLDPSTYFGGALAEGLVKGVSAGGAKALTQIGRIAPETEAGLRMAGTGIKDALGRAFQYGYKSTDGAKEDILTFMSRKQQARLGLAASNLNRLGVGTLTEAQSKELALKLVGGKRSEFLARESGQAFSTKDLLNSMTPETRAVAEKQLERSGKFASDLGISNPYEVYFPFIKQDKVAKFVQETGSLRVGSEGYLKQFKNLLTNDNMELNPAKAFFTRESQIVSDKMTRSFLQGFVDKYGVPLESFASKEDALKNGYQIMREKGIFGKELGYVNKWDASLIRDSISPEFQTINMLAKATGFDAVTSLFKRSVTGLFVPFHVRNYMSGMIQNFEVLGKDALNPANISVGQKIAYLMAKGDKLPKDLIKLGDKTFKFDQLIKPFTERFSGDTLYNADWEYAVKAGELKQSAKLFSPERIKETIKTAGLGQEGIPFRIARATGQFIEHQQKAVAYVTALGQGKSVKEALNLAERAGFDYRAVTRFESQIMRRIVPFYSFTRKNIELQLKTLGENPQRINQVLSFFQNMGDTISADEKKSLPDYLKESIGIKISDTPEGLKQYVASFGTPIEVFTQLFGSNPVLRTISQTNPLIKVPLEIGTGKDSFRQKDLKDVYDAREYKLAPKAIKDLLDIKEVQKDVLKKLPSGKLVKVGTRTQYVADPVRLLVARSLFTSRGVTYLDQLFGGDIKGLARVLKTTTGLKPAQIDLEQQASIADSQKKRAIEDELTKLGVTKQFTKTYVKK